MILDNAARGNPAGPDSSKVRADFPSSVDRIKHNLALLLGASESVEIRILGTDGRMTAQLFTDAAKAATWASVQSGKKSTQAVYFPFNPFSLEALQADQWRSVNDPLKAKTVSDRHILRRAWILVDLDPVRPDDTSATTEEKDLALDRARVIRNDMVARGWPDPIFCDSGNGGHLLFAIDLPADDKGLVSRCLLALASRYDDASVKVDTVVFNPARITKCYGTVTRKGPGTPDRPHRHSDVLDVPDAIEAVSRELLEALWDEVKPAIAPIPPPTPKAKTDNQKKASEPFDAFRMRATTSGSRPDLETRAVLYLDKCQAAISGQRGHKQAFKVACRVGPGFDLSEETAFRLLWDHYNPRCQPHWSEKELRHKVADAFAKAITRGFFLVDRADWKSAGQGANSGAGNGASNGAKVDPPKPGDPPTVLATRCLKGHPVEITEWLAPDRIPLGKLVILAGEGGLGKSSLTLEWAARLSRGEPLFGPIAGQEPSDVEGPAGTLLMAIEDSLASTQIPRLLAAGADLSLVHTVDGIRRKDNGEPVPFSLAHYQVLEDTLETIHTNIRLVIVDPAAAFVGRAGTDDHRNAELTALLAPLQKLAERRRVTIVLVLHLNKGAGAKAVHRVMGGVAYVNSSRGAYVVAPDPDDPDCKVLAAIKLNDAPLPKSVKYSLQRLDDTEQQTILSMPEFDRLQDKHRARMGRQLARIQWDGETDATAETSLATKTEGQKRAGNQDKRPQAKAWLHAFLAKGRCPSGKVTEEAKEAGFGKNMIWEVFGELKDEFKVKPVKITGSDGTTCWFWPQLPEPTLPVNSPGSQENTPHPGWKDGWETWETSINSTNSTNNTNHTNSPKSPSEREGELKANPFAIFDVVAYGSPAPYSDTRANGGH